MTPQETINSLCVMLSDENAKILRDLAAEIWNQGFDAGEEDLQRHQAADDYDIPCIKNPYKDHA